MDGVFLVWVEAADAGGLAERDFPFGTGRSKETYAGCQTCHAVPGWSTGAIVWTRTDPPLTLCNA